MSSGEKVGTIITIGVVMVVGFLLAFFAWGLLAEQRYFATGGLLVDEVSPLVEGLVTVSIFLLAAGVSALIWRRERRKWSP